MGGWTRGIKKGSPLAVDADLPEIIDNGDERKVSVNDFKLEQTLKEILVELRDIKQLLVIATD